MVGGARSALSDLQPGSTVNDLDPSGPLTVVAVEWHGDQALNLTYRTATGHVGERLVFQSDVGTFHVTSGDQRTWTFDGDAGLFRLAAEARRIQLAHLFDPYVALSSSEIEPLPHQITAVYGELLSQHPLRFLLADDPGAGKTIMAGLYIKELMIRGDADRVLIVAPGSLVTQWQDELRDKFGLRFSIVTKEMLDEPAGDVLGGHDRLIARVDQLARRNDLVERLASSEWDLIVVDEATACPPMCSATRSRRPSGMCLARPSASRPAISS